MACANNAALFARQPARSPQKIRPRTQHAGGLQTELTVLKTKTDQ